jgi:hypothetical protein
MGCRNEKSWRAFGTSVLTNDGSSEIVMFEVQRECDIDVVVAYSAAFQGRLLQVASSDRTNTLIINALSCIHLIDLIACAVITH